MKYEKGMRVKRTQGEATDPIHSGDIGVLARENNGYGWYVQNQRTGREERWSFDYFEPADAPAVGAPGECGDCVPVAPAPFSGVNRETKGDLQGTVAALRSRVDELEGDLCFWKREAIRLGAKARGGR